MKSGPPRPALGQVIQIGKLYDSRTDSFLPSSVFTSSPPPDDVLVRTPVTAAAGTTIRTVSSDTYKDKFELLGVHPDLGASILGYLVELDGRSGSGAYLSRRRATNRVAQAALLYRLLTVKERIDRRSRNLPASTDSSALRGTHATHVVAAIDWGVEAIAEVSCRVEAGGADRAAAAVAALQSELEGGGATGHQDPAALDVHVLSDAFSAPENVGTIGAAAVMLRQRLPQTLGQSKGQGQGRPITYWLMPVSVFMGYIQDDDEDDDLGGYGAAAIGATAIQVSPEHLDRFHNTLQELEAAYRRLADYATFLSAHPDYSSPDHARTVRQRAGDVQHAIRQAQARYGQALRDVRMGSSPAAVLQDLHGSLVQGDTGPLQAVSLVDQERAKVELAALAVQSGARYVGRDSRIDPADIPRQNARSGQAVYVMTLSCEATRGEQWAAHEALLRELLDTEQRSGAQVWVVDYDAIGQPLAEAKIAEYQGGNEVTADLLDRRRVLVDKCFAQCPEQSLETRDIQKPVKRRFVKIPCPGPMCDARSTLAWTCPRCLHPLEYGCSDQYIYCDCGRSRFANFAFKCCNAAVHGPRYTPYGSKGQLQALLDGLPASTDYINILILGETGVGKSTFINAFANYLTFDSLDEALKCPEFHWVIPCSFSTQTMDRNQPGGKIKQHKIRIGDRSDEHDGSKGDSATQQTSVYPITVGEKTIRLIDTPGVGDTRGVQFDKKNMADILATLNSYEELHGILILLKSNSARLTITFEFCIKELLTHLHKSAVNNIAFGFTNTRISNYAPGDTFGPLETLLAKQQDVHLPLDMNTSYCFDSESFRYLAAHKQGIYMENEEDFRRSWRHSCDETRRLVNYFASKAPHSVTSTISLNGTRLLILELTKPLADISQQIRKNIAMCQDRERELADARLTGHELFQKLQVSKLLRRKKELGEPRTVCADRECIEVTHDEEGRQLTVYNSHCHPQCYLKDVPAEQLGHADLIQCAAFNGSDHCRICRHHWRQHLHIYYEFEEYTATLTDPGVEKALAANASDATLRQTALQEAKQRIREYEEEHKLVGEAAAQFGLYLKKHSITSYNDATLAYLDMLIKLEEEKIEVGGSKALLDSLREDRRRHEELVKALTNGMKQPAGTQGSYTVLDEAGVDAVVRRLYRLKHFGEQLKMVKNTISAAQQATYRERPYRVGGRKPHAPSAGSSRGAAPAAAGSIMSLGGVVGGKVSSLLGMATRSTSPPSQSGPRYPASKSSHGRGGPSWPAIPLRSNGLSPSLSVSGRSSSSQSASHGTVAVSSTSYASESFFPSRQPARQPSPPPQDPPPPYPSSGGPSVGADRSNSSWSTNFW
ncbi:p-loop containing nucleoside triphosphate hydrolase [Podospora aff. communis PSN243]|uniref:P-loop containing nucleoside triphosphate hydrolase n=1 Tax=Podospora aff. communis PSN243 TaxID=3040156 RepID=A0AAV9GN19_9PEZI|nr:p-loop containing nucleoside triphosphate hydrolase [Podospora aff. communis PSN243]